MADPAEEIAWLEHELATLRSQYRLLERNGRVMKLMCQLMAVVLVIFLGYLMWIDVVMGAFATAMAAAIAALVWYTRRPGSVRWIDAGTLTGNEFDRGPSQAQKVEGWIAEREGRLAELRSPTGSAGAG